MRANRIAQFDATAKKIFSNKACYDLIAQAVWPGANEPRWWFVGIAHEREASCDFTKQLGQGDPLDEKSIHDPAGRGPFFNHPNDPPGQDAFYRGALDALNDCPPYAARWKDWTIGGILTLFEEYNGMGYAMMGVPSAYVWSGTDQYVSGKYVADHVYRAGVIDVQEGCAPILSRIMAIDPTVEFMA